MKILAIDTSTDYLSVAITDGNRTLARFHRKVGRRHSDLLVPTIKSLVKRCGMRPEDLSALFVGVGPGSFTGLRIGVATIKAMAYALRIPIVAVGSLDAIAGNASGHKGLVSPVLDARKNKVYACLYRSDGKAVRRISRYLLLTAGELAKKVAGREVLFLGDGVDILKAAGIAACEVLKYWQPKAETVARLGMEDLKKNRFKTAEELEPLFLYSKECDITGR